MKGIQEKLVGAGLIIREARLKHRSLTGIERSIILRIRSEAKAAGYGREDINRHEMDGDAGRYGLRPEPYEAVFYGIETLPNGMKIRNYNVQGDHPLNGSTLGVYELVNNRIWPYDINVPRVVFEYLKEAFVILWAKVSMWGLK